MTPQEVERALADEPAVTWTEVLAGFVVGLLLAIGLHGCTPTIRQQAINVGSTAARVSDVHTTTVLARYCTEQMRILGHPSLYENDRCRRADTETVPASSASPDQVTQLAALRVHWDPVLAAHEGVVRTQNVLAGLLNAGAAATEGQILAALAELVKAYDDLKRAADLIGFTMPDLLGGSNGNAR